MNEIGLDLATSYHVADTGSGELAWAGCFARGLKSWKRLNFCSSCLSFDAMKLKLLILVWRHFCLGRASTDFLSRLIFVEPQKSGCYSRDRCSWTLEASYSEQCLPCSKHSWMASSTHQCWTALSWSSYRPLIFFFFQLLLLSEACRMFSAPALQQP